MKEEGKTGIPKVSTPSLSPDQQAAEADLDPTGRVKTYLKLADVALARDTRIQLQEAQDAPPEEDPLSKTG